MKILAVHSDFGNPKKTKAIDMWRISRPIREIKKHVDWQIDEWPTFIQEIEKYGSVKEFTADELEKAAQKLGGYDIIWSTYFSNPTFYALLRAVQARYGTKFIMDVDDDLFSIKIDNPLWLKLTDENVYHMQCMARDADYITTTTEQLAHVLRERRDKPAESVFVVPNYITDTYQSKPPANKRTRIGYFGGSSHFDDIDQSGVIGALRRLMNENKDVEFFSCGVPIEEYLPKARYTYLEGAPGHDWVDKVFPQLQYDIAIAPLEECRFADGKSNIKWQEATRMGAAFVASKTGPYLDLQDQKNAILVNNKEEEWYEALKSLVEDKQKRQQLVENAQKELEYWRLELNWPQLVEVFEKVKAS